MPNTVLVCPGCGRRLAVPREPLGRWIKCPHCGMGFAAMPDDLPASEPVPEVDDSLPPQRSLLLPLVVALASGLLLTAIMLAVVVAHRAKQPSAPAAQVQRPPQDRVAPAARSLGAAAPTVFTLLAETVYVLIAVGVGGGLTLAHYLAV